MRIAFITAGAAGMYCGSCMNDNTLVHALQARGVEVTLIPTYTPIRTDEQDVSIQRVFFGGINVFLQQKIPFFRKTPWLFDKMFNHPRLLRWVSRFSSSTKAEDLGALTVSVLKGEDGNQRKELEKLVRWLKEDYKPNMVQITNSMFNGFARMIKKELNVPVVCSLKGEELFLDAMIQPYRDQARQLLYERSSDLDGFIVNSHFYREFMSEYLRVPADKMHVATLGLNLDGFEQAHRRDEGGPFTVGYLARVCPEKGIHIAIEAFHKLCVKVGRENVLLKIAGFTPKTDKPFLDEMLEKAEGWGIRDRIEYHGELTREEKIQFIRSLDVFSVPAPYKEPKGLYVLESLACGVPVVQPQHGAFIEMLEQTGGGILVKPHSPEACAEGLEKLYGDRALAHQLGDAGREAVFSKFTNNAMADQMLAFYERILPGQAGQRTR